MNEQPPRRPIDDVLFLFAGVVGHIVEERKLRFGQHFAEHFAGEMREDLTVRERAVDPGAHGAEIPTTHLRTQRGTSKLTVGKLDAMLRGRDRHLA